MMPPLVPWLKCFDSPSPFLGGAGFVVASNTIPLFQATLGHVRGLDESLLGESLTVSQHRERLAVQVEGGWETHTNVAPEDVAELVSSRA